MDYLRVIQVKDDNNVNLGVTGGLGSGKCQPKGSKVLMANGEVKNIEELKVGERVLSPQPDGTYIFADIEKVCNWYSNENYDVFDLRRTRKKLYSCSFNHLIPVNYRRKNGQMILRNITARRYSKYSDKTFKKKTTSNSCFPIPYFENRKNCEIEPYCLGVWLGDGHFKSSRIMHTISESFRRRGHYKKLQNGKTVWERGTVCKNYRYGNSKGSLSRDLGITTMDLEIINEVSKFYEYRNKHTKKNNLATTYRYSPHKSLGKLLSQYNLEGKRSGTKFIPKEALLSDIKYRKRLLAGLVDTDGYYHNGGYSITTKSKQLAEDIYFLIQSLGARGGIRKIRKGIKKLNFVGTYYDVSFYLGNIKIPVMLKRKQRDVGVFYLSANRRCIDVRLGTPGMVYGIDISGPSKWYITDNFMITHNSTFSIQVARRYIERYMGGVHGSFDMEKYIAYNNEDVIEKIYSLPPYSPLIGDEAVRFAWSRDWNKAENKELAKLSTQIRTKKLIFFMNIPKLPWIDSAYREQLLDIWVWIHSSFSGGKKTGYAMIFEPDRNQAETDSWHLNTLKKHMRKKERIGRFTEIQRLFRIVKYNPCFVDAFPFPKLPEDLYQVYLKVRDKRAFETTRQQITQKDMAKIILYNLKQNWGKLVNELETRRFDTPTNKIMAEFLLKHPLTGKEVIGTNSIQKWYNDVKSTLPIEKQ